MSLDDTVVDLYVKDGKSTRAISKLLGVGRTRVKTILKKNKIELRFQWKGSPAEDRLDLFDGKSPVGNYWIGFLMADGNIGIRKGKTTPSIVQLGLAEVDLAHIEKFKKYIGCDHKISKNFVKRKFVLYNFQFTSETIAAKLIKFGVTPKKSLTCEVSSDLALDIDFWRGCIDGDGSVYTAKFKEGTYELPAISFCGSEAMLKQFVVFVRKHTNQDYVISKTKNLYYTAIVGKNALKLIQVLYTKPCEVLARKNAKAIEFIQHYGAKYAQGSDNNTYFDGHKRCMMEGDTHCIHGHEMTPENTFVDNPSYKCRECWKICYTKSNHKRRGKPSQ